MKVLVGTSSFAALDKSPLHKLLDSGFEVFENPFKRKLLKEELVELLKGVTGVIAGLEQYDREVMAQSQLKVISRCGSGTSNVDLNAAEELGITVCRTPLGPAQAVAELTVGCLLALLRQVPQMDRALHNKEWKKSIGRQLKGMTVAVIGFGNIGQCVGRLLLGLGAEVIAVDPLCPGYEYAIPMVSFAEAIRRADVITIHSSGEDCLFGERELASVKEGVFLLNAARGGLVDEQALKKALDDKRVAGAWLDTFSNEPYNGLLCGYEQVILTPHVGSYTFECRRDMEMESVINLINALAGEIG